MTEHATATLSPQPPEPAAASGTEALVERLFAAVIGALEIASIHVGGRLGLYRALADGGDATARQLAARTGTDERYVREWLEQQAVAGFLTADAAADPAERRYGLPAPHRPVLVDEDDLSFLTPFASLAIGVCRPLDALLEANRTGEGVPFEAYGPDLVTDIGAANRPQFLTLMGDWLGAVPDVHARLVADPAARVADVAAGRPGRASPSRAPIRR